MKGYSPLRRWLREERAREHAMMPAGGIFEVQAPAYSISTARVLVATRGPSNMREGANTDVDYVCREVADGFVRIANRGAERLRGAMVAAFPWRT